MNEVCEMDYSAIVARCETTKMFEVIEASLYTIAVRVKSAVVRDDHLAVPFCRNDTLCFHGSDLFVEPIAVISLIGDDRACSVAFP
ncbi:hypothetical protein AD940_11050 [Gluconobacter thailandicus]|nr:hypothetical protein AD940_11050 [Gluconobacter thailandicus]